METARANTFTTESSSQSQPKADDEIEERKTIEERPTLSGRRQVKRSKISKEAARVLSKWICAHKEYPYPLEDEFEELSAETGLPERQIRIWMTNYRNRKLPPSVSCLSKIKYKLMHKNVKEIWNPSSRSKVVNEAAKEYLQRYFCCCNTSISVPISSRKKEGVAQRAAAFFKNSGY
eukprot:CAMPEP_0168341750 /NCGR_PEP_ID=MMETSP0213-20121227/14914_1 /TAXON_ID=151035 /ORGANISM="Euplotes harpa, Strain FSP1.4" /LENGTH=176 /DNA_ID=CAMNT_0008348375 /DNA_START=233 /DNA_END=763 /DNA_ORIENTATION=+